MFEKPKSPSRLCLLVVLDIFNLSNELGNQNRLIVGLLSGLIGSRFDCDLEETRRMPLEIE